MNLFSLIDEVFDSVNTDPCFTRATVYILGYILASSNNNCLEFGKFTVFYRVKEERLSLNNPDN